MQPDAAWWSASGPASFDPANPAAEPVLSLQRELQGEALAGLSDHARGATDLYFVAFAPDSGAGAWRERVEAARDAMDAHWGTEGRSLVYVNDFASLTGVPIASVTHLREALEEIAAASDPEEDVVMLYLAGRSNADGSMTVDLPPLGLVQLSGPGLASLLAQAGIRWRVIVVATCAPQPFVDALADAETLVMAAAGGCDASGEPPGFHEALFGGALTAATTLPHARRVPVALRGRRHELSHPGPLPHGPRRLLGYAAHPGLATLMAQGLVTLERVAQDGVRVRAGAGAASFRRRKTLEACLVEAEVQVRTLRAELEADPGATSERQRKARERAARERTERVARALAQLPSLEAKKKPEDRTKARASTTDPEARVMKMADGGYRPAYNLQFATDTG